MGEEKLVTVVTLTYKDFSFLKETIFSVLSQNYSKIEYIISDDGSENFPKESIETFVLQNKKNNIVSLNIISRDKNVGTVKNVNVAYKAAKGEIIIPLSCGDCFESENAIAEIVKTFEQRGCDFLICGRHFVDNDNNVIVDMPTSKQQKKINKLDTATKQLKAYAIGKNNYMAAGCTTYVKKSFIEKYNYFDERFVLWEDQPFYFKLLMQNIKLEFCYDIKINYRCGGISNLSRKNANKIMQADIRFFNENILRPLAKSYKGITRRRITAICDRFLIDKKGQLILHYFKYFDVYILKFFEKIFK